MQSKNKVSLRNLSMVLRQLPVADKTAPGKQVLESVELARQAVQLDVADGTSWCEYPSGSLQSVKLNKCLQNQGSKQRLYSSMLHKYCSFKLTPGAFVNCLFLCMQSSWEMPMYSYFSPADRIHSFLNKL